MPGSELSGSDTERTVPGTSRPMFAARKITYASVVSGNHQSAMLSSTESNGSAWTRSSRPWTPSSSQCPSTSLQTDRVHASGSMNQRYETPTRA